MATKNYIINDKWQDLGIENILEFQSVDGVVESLAGSLIYEDEISVDNYTSTSSETLKTIPIDNITDISPTYTKPVWLLASVERKNRENGYFYKTATILFFSLNNAGTKICNSNTLTIRAATSSGIDLNSASTSAYGVYVSTYTAAEGTLGINARYNASYSLTIDGDFTIKLYKLNI